MDEFVTRRAQEVQQEHKKLLEVLAVGLSNEGALAIEAKLFALRQGFMTEMLSRFGLAFPYQLDRSNGDHAIVVAVRDDIADTENQIELQRRARRNLIELKKINEWKFLGFPELPKPPNLNLVFVVIGVVAVALVALSFSRR